MCMTFKLPAAKDASVVAGRSMEFPMGMPSKLTALPRGFSPQHAPSDGGAALAWQSIHGVVGISVFDHPGWLVDGLNTEGLSAHLLYMPGGYCTYPEARGDGTDLAQLDLVAFLLGTCASVEEVRAAAERLTIIGRDPGMGFIPPIHCLVHDVTGSLAIEFHPDAVRVVDNPVAVATNAPFLDWHLINLGNYLGISAENPRPEVIGGLTVAPLGQGEGLRGIPSDFTPASRFVRLCSYLQLAEQAEDASSAEQLALHVLNAFDILPGLITEQLGAAVVPEVTVWDTVLNLSQPRYAYRTISNPETFVVDLDAVDFSLPTRSLELEWNGAFTPLSL
jgi:choloylglycine hydrolase